MVASCFWKLCHIGKELVKIKFPYKEQEDEMVGRMWTVVQLQLCN